MAQSSAASARGLAWLALLGGILQLAASVRLGLARLGSLESAASEGPRIYVLATAGAAVGLAVAWRLRRRPGLAAGVLILWQLAVFWPVHRRTSGLGATYWGEAILHHFLALASAAGLVVMALGWAREHALPRTRRALAALFLLGVVLLLVAHTAALPRLWRWPVADIVQSAGTSLILTGCVIAQAVLWNSITSGPLRFVSVALLAAPLLRVASAGVAGLHGAPVPDAMEWLVMGSVIVAATSAYASIRPRVEIWLHAVVTLGSALATATLYVAYRRGFGELEDGLDGLTQSLFGFPLPYPTYVASWKVLAVMLAVFFIISTVYASLVSSKERDVGLGLGLLAVTGIGLSSPQLVLMGALGYSWFLESARRQASGRAPARPPPVSVPDLLRETAQELGLGEPVSLSEGTAKVLATDGETHGTRLRIRARHRGERWTVQLTVGLPGRGRPICELRPDPGQHGSRPAHPLGRTHRIKGQLRHLETLGDGPLDALLSFPGARARIWAAGVEVDLGPDLSALQTETLAGLIRNLLPLVD